MGHPLSSTSVFEPQSLRASSLGTVNCQPQVHPTATATSSFFRGPCQSPSLYLTPATNHLPSVSILRLFLKQIHLALDFFLAQMLVFVQAPLLQLFPLKLLLLCA